MNTGMEVSALGLDMGVSGTKQVSGANVVAPVSGAQDVSFADAVKNAGTNVVNSLTGAEATSIAGLKGDAGPYAVASSMMEAEQNLRMTIAVRDKAIQAYQEISRMQI